MCNKIITSVGVYIFQLKPMQMFIYLAKSFPSSNELQVVCEYYNLTYFEIIRVPLKIKSNIYTS